MRLHAGWPPFFFVLRGWKFRRRGCRGEYFSPESVQQCRMPEASGTVVYGEEPWSLDASHTEDGYVMVSYSGSADKIKVRITYPDDTKYIYPMKLGRARRRFL